MNRLSLLTRPSSSSEIPHNEFNCLEPQKGDAVLADEGFKRKLAVILSADVGGYKYMDELKHNFAVLLAIGKRCEILTKVIATKGDFKWIF